MLRLEDDAARLIRANGGAIARDVKARHVWLTLRLFQTSITEQGTNRVWMSVPCLKWKFVLADETEPLAFAFGSNPNSWRAQAGGPPHTVAEAHATIHGSVNDYSNKAPEMHATMWRDAPWPVWRWLPGAMERMVPELDDLERDPDVDD